MKIIYENCGVKNFMKEDHRSYRRNFCSWPLWYRCSALTNWANKPTGSRSLNWFVLNPWKEDDGVMNTWKSFMITAGWRIIRKKIIAVIDAIFSVAKRKPEKIQACTGFETLTSAIPPGDQKVASIIAMIFFHIIIIQYVNLDGSWTVLTHTALELNI